MRTLQTSVLNSRPSRTARSVKPLGACQDLVLNIRSQDPLAGPLRWASFPAHPLAKRSQQGGGACIIRCFVLRPWESAASLHGHASPTRSIITHARAACLSRCTCLSLPLVPSPSGWSIDN